MPIERKGEIPEETRNWIEGKIKERVEMFGRMEGVEPSQAYAYAIGGRRLAVDMYDKLTGK